MPDGDRYFDHKIAEKFQQKLFTFFVSDGVLYTGTVADFSGMDPIIYREPLQTEQYDSMSLNGKFFSSISFIFFSYPISNDYGPTGYIYWVKDFLFRHLLAIRVCFSLG